MRSLYSIALVCLLVVLTPFNRLDASSDLRSAPHALAQRFQALEDALNNRAQPLQKVHILHDQISAQAVFKITVDNPALSPAQNATRFEMDKTDYINSFLLGGRHVADYHASIQVVSIDPDVRSGQMVSTILLEESGAVLDVRYQGKRGRNFLSHTVCRSLHGRNLQILSSACDTAVSYNHSV